MELLFFSGEEKVPHQRSERKATAAVTADPMPSRSPFVRPGDEEWDEDDGPSRGGDWLLEEDEDLSAAQQIIPSHPPFVSMKLRMTSEEK